MENLPTSRSLAKAESNPLYFTSKPCKYGHLAPRRTASTNCLICEREFNTSEKYKAKARLREKTEEQKEKARQYARKRHSENRDQLVEDMRVRNKKYYAKNSEKIKQAASKYQSENTEARTAYKREWSKAKAKIDPSYKMMLVARRMLQRSLGISGQKKYKRTFDYLGYTSEDLVTHLESLFQDGMRWENYGDWHIDHIKPLAAYSIEGVTDPKILNSLNNLQPLWAKENMEKGARYAND